MGYGDLSCFGGSEVVTPEIDRMAVEGMKLTKLDTKKGTTLMRRGNVKGFCSSVDRRTCQRNTYRS